MFVVRNVFKCKPGKAKNLIEKLKKANELMKGAGAVINERVLVDEVATFWTVVIETEVEDMAKFAESMQTARVPTCRKPWPAIWIWSTAATARSFALSEFSVITYQFSAIPESKPVVIGPP